MAREPNARLNVTLDAQYAEKLSRLAERTHTQEGTLARSLLSQALDEVSDARVYGGMHYRNSTRTGANIGKQVSRYATTHYFRPSRGRND